MNLITIQLTATDAVSIASLIETTKVRDAVDVLEQVRILPTLAGDLMAVGTNRYILAQYKITGAEVDGDLPADGIGLTAAACKFIAANVKRVNKWTDPAPVEIVANIETREFSVRHGAAVMGGEWPAGKYPATALGIVESWEPAPANNPVKLGTAFLNTLGKLVDAFSKVDAWTLELGDVSTELGREKGRPGPLRATAGNFTALIQPRLDK